MGQRSNAIFNHWALAFSLFGLLALLYLLSVLVHPGSIGISYDWNVPQSPVSFVQSPLATAWSNGEPTPPGNGIFFWVIFKILFWFKLSSSTIVYLVLVLSLTFSGFHLYLLGRQLKLRAAVAFIAGVLYMSSQQLLVLVHHGYLFSLIAFALTPLLLLVFVKYQNQPTLRLALLGSLVFSFASIQPQFFIINTLLLLSFSFLKLKKRTYIVRFFLLLFLVNIVLSSSWLSMFFFYIDVHTYAQEALQSGHRGFQYNGIIDLLSLPFTTANVREYFHAMGLSWLSIFWQFSQALIFAVPLFFLSFLRSDRNKHLIRVAVVCLVIFVSGLILAKGRASPFQWTGELFYRLPLSGLFRDLNHFYYLISFSVSMLFAIALEYFWSIFQRRAWKKFMTGLIVFIFISISPYLLNVYSSQLHQYQLEMKSYKSLQDRYNPRVPGAMRVLWLPLGTFVVLSGEQSKFSGINPLVRTVSALPASEYSPEPAQPTIEQQLVYFNYCSRIPGCAERLLGLKSIRDILLLKRDFSASAPYIAPKQYSRSWEYWTNSVSENWIRSLRFGSMQSENDAYNLFELDRSVITPMASVPKQLVYLGGSSPESLIDGVVLSKVVESGFVTDDGLQSNAKQLVIPIDFSERSPTQISHNSYQLLASASIPKSGDYQIVFYQKSGLTSSPLTIFTLQGIDHLQRKIVLEKLDTVPKHLREKNPAYTGLVSLQRGTYELILSNSVDANNLILDPSFAAGPWPDRSINCPLEGDAKAVVKDDPQRGAYLELSNKTVGACQMTVVGNIIPRQKYLLSFDVQHISGSMPSVCLQLNEDDYCHGRFTLSETESNWQHSEIIYEQGSSESAIIRLVVPGGNRQSINRFDNIELRRVAVPETMAFVHDQNQVAPYYTVKKVEMRREGNIRYRVLIRQGSGNVPLVFTENFHPGWRAYIKRTAPHLDGLSSINTSMQRMPRLVQKAASVFQALTETMRLRPIEDHRIINKTSNVWFLNLPEQPSDTEIIIEFTPQRVYSFGVLAASMTIALIVLYCTISSLMDLYHRRRMR